MFLADMISALVLSALAHNQQYIKTIQLNSDKYKHEFQHDIIFSTPTLKGADRLIIGCTDQK